MFGAIVAAENERDRPRQLSREDVERTGEGLLDEAHLGLFLTWYQLGGMQSPPSLLEVAAWPAALRHDILFLVRELGDMRAAEGRRKERKRRHDRTDS